MGVRGAKPSIEKALTERPTFVPTGAREGIERPEDLSPAAVPIWDVLLDDLCSMGVFKPADSIILVEVCEMLAEAKRLRLSLDKPNKRWPLFERELNSDDAAEIMDDPETSAELWPMSSGYKRIRTSYLQTMRTLKSYIDEFGVTPVARLRLGLLTLQGQGLAELFASDDDAPPAIDGAWTDG